MESSRQPRRAEPPETPETPLKGTAARLALVLRDELPDELVEWAAAYGDANLADAVASRASLSDAAIARLLRHENDLVTEKLAWRGLLPPGPGGVPPAARERDASDEPTLTDAAWQGLSADPVPDVRAAVARRRDIGEDLLRRLATDPDRGVREAVAGNPRTPVEVLRALAFEGDVAEAAARTTTDPGLLRELAWHALADVRVAVARNDATPGDVLAELFASPARRPFLVTQCDTVERAAARVLAECADNPGLPRDAVTRAATHPDHGVRLVIAQRADLGEDALLALAGDADAVVRGMVARQDRLPVEMLREVADDASQFVREAVLRHPRCPFDLLERLAPRTADNLALSTPVRQATAAQVEALARSRSARLRQAVADRRGLPARTLDALVRDHKREVLIRVAANPDLTVDHIRGLHARRNAKIWTRIAELPQCPPDILADLVRQAASMPRVLVAVAAQPNTPPTDVRTLAAHPHPRVRSTVARRPDLPADLVAALAVDPHGEAAAAAACHPRLPRHAMDTVLGRQPT